MSGLGTPMHYGQGCGIVTDYHEGHEGERQGFRRERGRGRKCTHPVLVVGVEDQGRAIGRLLARPVALVPVCRAGDMLGRRGRRHGPCRRRPRCRCCRMPGGVHVRAGDASGAQRWPRPTFSRGTTGNVAGSSAGTPALRGAECMCGGRQCAGFRRSEVGGGWGVRQSVGHGRVRGR